MAEFAKREIDPIDHKILRALQEDGRITVQALSERVGISPSPCLRRVRQLEEAGIISGYGASIDPKAVGLPVSVFISIKLEQQRAQNLDDFGAAISRWPEVMDCYLMTGKFDFLMRVVCADLEAYETFLRKRLTQLDGVASIESSFSLGAVKSSRVLPI
ncbi:MULTISPECIES: Lrp/AsnC family transcriptional regulator [unclassified Devosia]|uniref:Lrp/AsnC family transcriptional regulator n=1 Tax=unclassified Devosia TaxID=196773 RepID=UPI00145D05A2|nr:MULTISPECIES: Lrp/AsnC family transcriptional regulator [unclassified Devosia]MBJ6987514.1 Lrp/AsnC family transcriptional regulator [Devosia sp. MC521]QMW61872.1 Lrp/AsnC family transcriptional regulator [Devosia sp. MC521]